MSRLSKELHLGDRQGKARPRDHLVFGFGMPRKDDVGAIERTGLEHERLAQEQLLGGRAKDLDRPRHLLLEARAVCRHARRDRRRPEEVVPATVAGRPLLLRILLRFTRLLREPRQRIVLGHDADHGGTASGGRHERRRDPADVALDLEPFFLEQFFDRRSGLVLLESRFRVFPDLSGQGLPARARLVEICVGRRRGGDDQRERKHDVLRGPQGTQNAL